MGGEQERTRGAVAATVAQNIETVFAVQVRAEERIGRHQLFVEKLTSALARPRTTYLFVLMMAVWGTANGLVGPARALDPAPFFWMQGFIGVAALLVTTVVLTTQRIQGIRAEQRAHLDLQVNLLAEQKIAKLISLLEELRRDMPSVHNRRDTQAEAMSEAVDPHQVVSAMDERLEAAGRTMPE